MQLQKILITGTNRGLGKQLVKHLAKNRPDLHLCLTLRNNIAETQKAWKQQYPNQSITCLPLDLMEKQSMDQFFNILKAKNYVFQYLINNAAVGADLGGSLPSPELAERTFYCNTTKTIQFTKRMFLGNFLTDDARVVNVSSGLGGLKYQPQDKQKLLNNQDNVTEEKIDMYIKQYIKQCTQKKLTWFDSCYGTSKLFLNSWSRFVLQQKIMNQKQIVICMSPGPCKTDMGPPKPQFTAQEGAKFIYDCIEMKDPKKGVFYHTGNQKGFQWCGTPKN